MVEVSIRKEMLKSGKETYEYSSLTGEMMDVKISMIFPSASAFMDPTGPVMPIFTAILILQEH